MKAAYRECLNCKIAEFEPECGYTCGAEYWTYLDKAHICPHYEVDEEYLLKHAKTFLDKVRVKKFIRKNKN